MEKQVMVIPASQKDTVEIAPLVERKRVAGYARVSTEFEEQQSSYTAQVEYYTKYILERRDWELVGIYTDEGITATNTKLREGFNKMIEDALDGRIDLIVTKSVSRFARNTVDCLSAIRMLKDKGIEVYFEKENIHTLDSKGELLITIMSSLAQEESRSISENVTWGLRKRFADGNFSVAYSRFLGYDKGADGKMEINHEEAKIVQLIYKLYLDGYSDYHIAGYLTAQNIPTPCKKEKWCVSTVRSILLNEKYKGDAMLQKTVTVDYLTKRKKKNEGEAPRYYVKGSHEAIIPPAVFDMAQTERGRRWELIKRTRLGKYSGVSIFCTKIRCGDCGCWYGPKTWHSGTRYEKVVFQCNSKYKKAEVCKTPNLSENDIKRLFVEAMRLSEWDDDAWGANVKSAVAYREGKVVFLLKNGGKMEVYLN